MAGADGHLPVLKNIDAASGLVTDSERPTTDVVLAGHPGASADPWLAQILEQWSLKRATSPAILFAVRRCLEESLHPREAALYLVEHCPDLHEKRTTSLACILAREAGRWIETRKPPPPPLAADLAERAFDIATRHHLLLFDALCDAADLRSRAADLAERTAQLVEARVSDDPVSTCRMVAKLGLQAYVGLAPFAAQLIVADRLDALELYVSGQTQLQHELVALFDGLCRPGEAVDELLRSMLGSSKLDGCKQQQRCPKRQALAKHGMRLMKKYGVPPTECPNLVDHHRVTSVRYLAVRYFKERGMSLGAFGELVECAADGRPRVCEEVAQLLYKNRETLLAARWAQHCNLPAKSLPAEVARTVAVLPPLAVSGGWFGVCQESEADNITGGESPYYSLTLRLSDVEMVDSAVAYRRFIDNVNRDEAGPVAIDCEWAPSFNSAGGERPLSIIQLAISTHVWILDMLALPSCLTAEDWSLIRQLFSNSDVVKIGFGFSEDFRKMASDIPGFVASDMVSFVDLLNLYSEIKPKISNGPGSGKAKGLAEVAKVMLGKVLDKREQMSNWERRPLRMAQLRYAALDAHCLLAIFDALLYQQADSTANGSSSTQKSQAQSAVQIVNGESQRLASIGRVRGGRSRQRRGCDRKSARASSAAVSGRDPPLAEKALSMPRGRGSNLKATATGSTASSYVAAVRWAAIDPVLGSSVDEPGQVGVMASDLRLAVDIMLCGLGKKLRSLGIDTYVAGNSDDSDDVAKLCMREGRTVLSAGEPYRRFCQLLPPDQCFAIDHTLDVQQQVQFVLDLFGIHLSHSDLFSRCQECNGGKYIEVKAEDMRELCRLASTVPSVQREQKQPAPTAASSDAAATVVASITIDFDRICLSNGTPLQLDGVRPGALEHVEVFRVCATCGKVYWIGSHHRRMAQHYLGHPKKHSTDAVALKLSTQ